MNDITNLSAELEFQAELYEKIIKVLQSKVNSGTVTLNLWDMGERLKKPSTFFQSIYDKDLNPTPAYEVIKKVLNTKQ